MFQKKVNRSESGQLPENKFTPAGVGFVPITVA